MSISFSSLALAGLLSIASIGVAQTTNYVIDPTHSQVDFSIKHLSISTVRGRFALKEGTIAFDAKDVSKSAVTAVIEVASVDTGTPQRDGHLKTADFFDTIKFPTAVFKSTSMKQVSGGYDVFGDLTLHGVTRPITLHLEDPSKEQTDSYGKVRRGFTASTTLHRQDFGLVWNGTLKSGDNVLGDDVKMTFDIEGAQS